jgi:DNA-binding MarR family transcriptional regulator
MQTISTTDLAHRLRPVLTRLARRMRQEASGDLSPTQSAALATIDCHGPLTPSELAARERIQRPTATRVLARLEEAGLIERTADPADRRSTLVAATASGHELLDVLRERKDAYLALRLDRLSPAELATLDRAAAILERVLGE